MYYVKFHEGVPIYLIQGLTHVSLLGCAGASIYEWPKELRYNRKCRNGSQRAVEGGEILLHNRIWLPRFFFGKGIGNLNPNLMWCGLSSLAQLTSFGRISKSVKDLVAE